MRESEEYLEANSILHDDYTEYVPLYYAKDAVKLAYKEGYLEALNKVRELIKDTYLYLPSWETIELEAKIDELKNVKNL